MDRISFFILNDNSFLTDILLLKKIVAENKIRDFDKFDVITFNEEDMAALSLEGEAFNKKQIEKDCELERKQISTKLGYQIEYYIIKRNISINQLREIKC